MVVSEEKAKSASFWPFLLVVPEKLRLSLSSSGLILALRGNANAHSSFVYLGAGAWFEANHGSALRK